MMVKVEDKRIFDREGNLKEPSDSKEKVEEKTKKNINFLPAPTFSEFILSLYASAMISMGAMEIKGSEKMEIDLTQAKQTIDIMEVIYKKTEGNLTQEEKSLFDNLMTELRLKFVDTMNKI